MKLCILFQGLHRLLGACLVMESGWTQLLLAQVWPRKFPLFSQLVIPSENLSTCSFNSTEYPVCFKIPSGMLRNGWRRETSEETFLVVQEGDRAGFSSTVPYLYLV